MCSPSTFRASVLPLAIALGVTVLVADAQSRPDPGPAQEPGDFIHVEFKGRLDQAAGAGGEHTGFQIQGSGVTWEVDASADPALLQNARELAGRPVVAKGSFGLRKSTARMRQILTVSAITAAAEQPPAEYIRVTMRGTLTTGVMAIGGESTGFTLAANGVTWELDMEPAQQARAASLDGRHALVSGQLRHVRGVEIRNRLIVKVQTLAEGGRR